MNENSNSEIFIEPAPLKKAEKKEVLYETLEAKIEIVKKMWEAAKQMRPPSNIDSPEQISEETQLLEMFVKENEARLPYISSLCEKYNELISERDKLLSHDDEDFTDDFIQKIDTVDREIKNLEKDDEVMFHNSLQNGVKNALNKRVRVREILASAGKAELKDALRKNNDLPDVFKEREAIKKVQVLPFSLAVFIDGKVYERYQGTDSRGCSLDIFSFIKNDTGEISPEAKVLLAIFGEKPKKGRKYKEEEYGRTILHEDFHSFIQGFAIGDLRLFNYKDYFRLIEGSADRIKKLKQLNAPREILENEILLLKKRLFKLPEMGHEELLAEIASKPHEQIPNSTFAAVIHNIEKSLDMIGEVDPEVDKIIEVARKKLNISEIKEQFQQLYAQTPEDKITDLEAALALLPVNKWGHIKGLIERWHREDGAEEVK
jgi:hypothetical protein